MTLHKTWFISDIHLDENQPEIAQKFIDLLAAANDQIDAIYLLGDVFETWIGDDDNTSFHLKIKAALKSVTARGIKMYFMKGNRDFLIGQRFMRETGCELLPDEHKILLYGTPILLMHGDTLCTRDINYLKARKLAHNRFLQTLFLLLPLTIRKKIAEKMRKKSKIHTSMMQTEIMDVTQEAVEQVMKKHEVTTLIHGHTHKPAIHPFILSGKDAKRIVLGAWHDKGSKLIWEENGAYKLVEF